MIGTLKTFKPIAKLADHSKNEIDLIQDYQKSKSSEIYCLMFVRYFNLLNMTAEGYFNLTADDKESFATEELSKALMDFSEDKGSFGGMLKTYYSNRLRTETQRLNTYRRSINYSVEYLDGLKDADGKDVKSQIADDRNPFSFVEMREALASISLNRRQLTYCLCKMIGGFSDSDIADRAGISSAAITKMRSSFKIKFQLFA